MKTPGPWTAAAISHRHTQVPPNATGHAAPAASSARTASAERWRAHQATAAATAAHSAHDIAGVVSRST